MGWLAGWSYRKAVTITGQSGAGTNYQVDFSIGDSAGGDFNLESHCTSFPNDIQVTDNDQTTPLDYWVEDLTVDPITMWVEVVDDLGSNVDICVYYGKSGESSASNGTNTFIAYHGAASADFHDSNIIPAEAFIYEAKARATADDVRMGWGVGTVGTIYDGPGGDIIRLAAHYNTNTYFTCWNDNTKSQIDEVDDFTLGTWYKLKIEYDFGVSGHGFKDSNEISTGLTTNLPNEAMGLAFDISTGAGEQEWSFARKYNSPEPAFSSAGSEESFIPIPMHHYRNMRET